MTGSVSTQLAARAAEWLPDEALVAAPALAAIDARAAAWSARWFPTPARRQANGATPAGVAVSPMPRHAWRRFAPGIWVDWGENTAQTLALHALGQAELRPRLTPDDENLVAILGERLARDLAMSLLKAPVRSPADRDEGPTRAVCFKLYWAPQGSSLTVAIDTAVMAGLRKQQCASWRPPGAQAQPLGAVIGSVPVAFEIALGSVSIGLLEFEAVEPGDTIVLDQPVAAPLALRAAATGVTIRDTRLVRQDGQLTLTAS